jgi:hypothetical protein
VTGTQPTSRAPSGATSWPAYRLIGRQFIVRNYQWRGAAVASRDAIYLIEMEPQAKGIGPVMAALSKLNFIEHVLLTEVLPNPPMQSERNPRTCFYAELSPDVTGHGDWPLCAGEPWWPVIVLARSDVDFIGKSWLRGALWLTVNNTPYQIYTLVLRRFGAVRALRELEWPV